MRKNLRYIAQPDIEYVLILSGDQLYRMDFREMLATHQAAGADVTIAAKPVNRCEAGSLGIMRVDPHGRVVGFLEKPQTDRELNDVAMDPQWLEARGIESRRPRLPGQHGHLPVQPRHARCGAREDQLPRFRQGGVSGRRSARGTCSCTCSTATGKTSARSARSTTPTCGWRSRTRRSSWRRPPRRFTRGPARCRRRGPTASRSQHSLVADGCVIGAGTRIENSVVGLRCRIGRDVTIRNSVIMGADFYETPAQLAADRDAGRPPIGIGDGTMIENAIVDKNCHVGAAHK